MSYPTVTKPLILPRGAWPSS